MNKFHRTMVDYVLLWKPFGGPPDDEIFPQFGLTPGQLRRRFRAIVQRMVAVEHQLDESDRERLAAVRRAYPGIFVPQNLSPAAMCQETIESRAILPAGQPAP